MSSRATLLLFLVAAGLVALGIFVALFFLFLREPSTPVATTTAVGAVPAAPPRAGAARATPSPPASRRPASPPAAAPPAKASAPAARGLVLLPGGEPAEGAAVLAFCLVELAEARPRLTNASGRFPLADLHEGHRYRLRARLDGFLPADAEFTVRPDEGPVLHLGIGARLVGRCTGAGGLPVERFHLRVVPTPDDETETAAELLLRPLLPASLRGLGPFFFGPEDGGRFEIVGLPPGRCSLVVRVGDGGPTFRHPDPRQEDLLLVAGRTTGPVHVLVPQSHDVAGGVIDAVSEAPIAGATIRYGPRGAAGDSVRTDEAGRFVLRGVFPETTYRVHAQGYAPAEGLVAALGAPPWDRIALHGEASVLVRVLDTNGDPLAGQRVGCFRLGTARTGAGGVARLGELPAGRAVQVYWLRDDGSFEFRAARPDPETPPEIVFGGSEQYLGSIVFGTVQAGAAALEEGFVSVAATGGGGNPLAAVSLRPGGTYRTGPIDPGRRIVTVSVGDNLHDNDHFFTREVDLEPGGVQLGFFLPAGVLDGEVLAGGAGTPRPLQGVLVEASRIPERGALPDGTTYRVRARARTDPAGRFRMQALPDGSYRIAFVAAGYRTGTEEVEIADGRATWSQVILLEPEPEGEGGGGT